MPMVVYTEEELIDAENAAEARGAERCAEDRERYRYALLNLVKVIDAAGLQNLSNGVQLGPTVWFVKASESVDAAKRLLGIVSEPAAAG